ncbi:hypothetical protein CLV51_102412 [Chitinophaga niastensis]|uniref:Uncharacterized protein n=1 Tax=Chitinophaga niastensis TaxID=536980 RepID=A0A2P8HMV4_CHINA|nr:hypothetical protein [Chitinophaga niastensis]PSL47555.1 hypothetical protein CLV51_102412 [Chitinophaga niastensis]
MHNPLALLSAALVNALLENGFTLFVRQSYPAGRDHTDTHIKEIFLITPYKDIGEANQHFQHIRFDHRKYIYQAQHTEEIAKLYVAAAQLSGYKVYAALLQQEEWDPPLYMDPAMRRYISLKTKWKPDRSEEVTAELFLHYGELYFTLKYGHEEIKVPLSDIEYD